VVPTSSLVPSTSRVVMVKVSPLRNSWGPLANFSNRILGPCRSTNTPTAYPCPLLPCERLRRFPRGHHASRGKGSCATHPRLLREATDVVVTSGCRAQRGNNLCASHESLGSKTWSARSFAVTGAGNSVAPSRYSSTCAATARPSAIAQTIRDAPRPASPATNTPSTSVL
jgi:hypothetical protein